MIGSSPAEFREQLRRAVLTIITAPDPDHRFLRERAAWRFQVVQSAHDAYGSVVEALRLITPTPGDLSNAEVVGGWLSWLRRSHGQPMLNLIFVWALGSPSWRVAQRWRVHPRTIKRRTDRALRLIYRHAFGDDAVITPALFDHGVVLNDELGHATYEPASRGTFEMGNASASKVWVGEYGQWRINGKRWRDGTEGL
jgi:hypothetical protein